MAPLEQVTLLSRPVERPVSERDDVELVQAVREGDDRAFEELYERYRSRISAFIRPMVKDHQRTEDLTQEVFLSALRRLRQTHAPVAFKPWLYEIARNACIDQHRRAQRGREVPLEEEFADVARHGAHGVSPQAALSTKEQIDDLCDAFAGLSRAQHEMLVMREFEGRSYRDIGERLNLTKPAVESALFRARRRLTEEYQALVSGDRCARVQRAILDAPAGPEPVHDWRIAMHVARCPGCRLQARRRGLRFVGTPPRRAAALLPLPAFWPRLVGGGLRSRMGAFWSGRSEWVARWSLTGGHDTTVPGLITAGAAAATVVLALGSASVLGAHTTHTVASPAAAGPVRVVVPLAPSYARVQPTAASHAPRTARSGRHQGRGRSHALAGRVITTGAVGARNSTRGAATTYASGAPGTVSHAVAGLSGGGGPSSTNQSAPLGLPALNTPSTGLPTIAAPPVHVPSIVAGPATGALPGAGTDGSVAPSVMRLVPGSASLPASTPGAVAGTLGLDSLRSVN